jgi:hypothetical protein
VTAGSRVLIGDVNWEERSAPKVTPTHNVTAERRAAVADDRNVLAKQSGTYVCEGATPSGGRPFRLARDTKGERETGGQGTGSLSPGSRRLWSLLLRSMHLRVRRLLRRGGGQRFGSGRVR